jgi:DNA repair protein RecO (recombination protein O)
MPVVSFPAIVLQVHSYSETSKILRLLTRTHGVRSAMARGALRPRSQFGGLLEAFSQGIATLYLKENRELQTLSGFELTRSGQALGRDLVRFGGASLLAELVLRTASESAEPELYDQFAAALEQLERAGQQELEQVALASAWALVRRLGYAPILDACSDCDHPLAPELDVAFDFAAGGARCAACAALRPGRPLPAHARAALVQLLAGVATPLPRTRAHWALLGRFLSHHVLDGGELRSLAFMAEALERR